MRVSGVEMRCLAGRNAVVEDSGSLVPLRDVILVLVQDAVSEAVSGVRNIFPTLFVIRSHCAVRSRTYSSTVWSIAMTVTSLIVSGPYRELQIYVCASAGEDSWSLA